MGHLVHSDMFARIAELLSVERGLELAIIFGSAAAHNMRIDSDVDIALLFNCPLSAKRKMEITERLELELLRDVDLVDMSKLSGTILQQTLCKGHVLIQKDAGVLADQVKKMIYNQTDMMPYVTRTLMERQQRFING
ncbi:MAG: nucleotidyltransferase domain-containing protein [Thiomicrorhabdus sp.]|nr:nucleotidyltransferase domain-containing protein [Thiomicrorhabdus sp.]